MKYNIGDLIVPDKEDFSSIAYITDYKKLEELYQLTWVYKDGRTAQILYHYTMLQDVLTYGYKLISVKK